MNLAVLISAASLLPLTSTAILQIFVVFLPAAERAVCSRWCASCAPRWQRISLGHRRQLTRPTQPHPNTITRTISLFIVVTQNAAQYTLNDAAATTTTTIGFVLLTHISEATPGRVGSPKEPCWIAGICSMWQYVALSCFPTFSMYFGIHNFFNPYAIGIYLSWFYCFLWLPRPPSWISRWPFPSMFKFWYSKSKFTFMLW